MICGIDPGLSGGVAFLSPNRLEVFPMPISTLQIANKKRRYIDIPNLCSLFISRNTEYCFIEKQQAMPNQGLSSTFKTGLGYGILLGVSHIYFSEVEHVRAREWKKYFGLSADKEEARSLASELYPDYKHLWKLKKHDGLAEAVLIAHWGNRNNE